MVNFERKKISVIASCYNETKNLWELYGRVSAVWDKFPQYDFELILADNGSTDDTVETMRALAAKDDRVKIIVNSRNFGVDRSSYNALRQATGDAAIRMASDLQDPPELIEDFIKAWESGQKIVVAIKNKSRENGIMFSIRKVYYRLMRSISEVEQIENFTGFGLYDRIVYEAMCKEDWPVPYMRGFVCELGFDRHVVYFTQPLRKHGKTSYNFLSYFDYAMKGITAYSILPLRLATLIGGMLSVTSIMVALFYLVFKLIFWASVPAGIAPLVIGLFFFSSVQILLVGLVGEYVLQILEHVRKKPLVMEKERINFDEKVEKK